MPYEQTRKLIKEVMRDYPLGIKEPPEILLRAVAVPLILVPIVVLETLRAPLDILGGIRRR